MTRLIGLQRAARFLWRALAALLTVSACVASAQVLDRIDVVPRANDAEVTIRFTQKIQYLRHGPTGSVKELRVFFRLVGTSFVDSELVQDSMSAPKTSRVVPLSVTYPELRNGMLIAFGQATTYSLRPGDDGRSIVLVLPLLPAPKSAPVAIPVAPQTPMPPSPAVAAAVAAPVVAVPSIDPGPSPDAPPQAPERTPAEIEALAAGYMKEARQANAAGNARLAINRLNRVLGLPENRQSELAQALVGEVREAAGDLVKAKGEYGTYLKLYPNGPNAKSIRQRLAALEGRVKPPPVVAEKAPDPSGWMVSGSVSSYYYTGKSQIETLTPPPPGELTFNRETLSMTDQRSLISSINLNARRRDMTTDTRIVVRDTNNRNYLDPERSYNRLYSAYVDHNDRGAGYSARVGRQTPTGMGVLDRFDGAQGGYNFNADWRTNAVLGRVVDFGSPYEKDFYGASLDFVPVSGRPGASLYVIEQKVEDFVSRRALGTEVRFFDGKVNAYGTVDYDVLYKGVNIAMLQANYLDGRGNNYFATLDYRRSPPYALTTALIAVPGVTLADMVNSQGLETVRAQVRDLSPVSQMASVGMTHQATTDWLFGIDYRWSSISSTRAVDATIPLDLAGTCLGTIDAVNNACVFSTAAQAGSGANHVVTLQAIGNNVFRRAASAIGSLSLIRAPTYNGQSYSLSYVLPIGDAWRIDGNLRYYAQKDDNGATQDRMSPSVKLAWQWRSSWFVDAEFGQEKSKSTSIDPAAGETESTSRRRYWSLGLRWDFR